MPAASHVEKDGHFTNTQRLLQWHDKALEPPGDARSELWFMHHLFKRVQRALRGLDARPRLADREPHVGLPGGRRAPRARRRGGAARRSTATTSPTGEPVPGFAELKADGSTACGCWIYSRRATPTASTRRGAATRATSTRQGGWVSPEWAWAWPANRRMLYNRASRRPRGQAVVGAQEVRLVGRGAGASGRATTSPTSRSTSRPDYRPRRRRQGHGRDRRHRPVHHDGRRQGLAVRAGRPARRAAADALRAARVAGRATCCTPRSARNPAALTLEPPGQPGARRRATRAIPLVATTFRLTEHHTAGAMSRNLPWLAELQPEMFAEIDPILAADARDRGRRLDGRSRPSARRSRRARG